MLIFTWMPIKVLWANSMLVSVRKLWGIFPIKQKFDTMAAFLYSKNFETRIISSSKFATIVQISLYLVAILHDGIHFLVWVNWSGSDNFCYLQKTAIALNFCLIGKIPHNFPILRSIESAQKTFIVIQVRVSVECSVLQKSYCALTEL